MKQKLSYREHQIKRNSRNFKRYPNKTSKNELSEKMKGAAELINKVFNKDF
jgi:hypothetical protein